MLRIHSWIQALDIFGQRVQLNFGANEQHRTLFGGLASLTSIFVIILVFQSSFADFASKTKLTVIEKEFFNRSPDLITLNDDNFMIAVSIQQKSLSFTERPYFNISLQQRNYTRLNNGTTLRSTKILNMIPCTQDRFDKVFKNKFNFTDEFNQLQLSTWLCPDYNYTMDLLGTYSNSVFLYSTILVTNCTNNTDGFKWQPICAPIDVATQDYKSSGQFKIQMYMTNNVINPNNANDYIEPYFDDQLYFTFVIYIFQQIPYQLSRQANIYWKMHNFQNDLSLLPYQDIQNESYAIRSDSEFRDLTNLGTATDSVFAQLFLRRSNFNIEYDRNFQKFTTLMSSLGGFLQIILFIFSIVVTLYNKQSYLFQLANQLYDFELDEDHLTTQNMNRKQINLQTQREIYHQPLNSLGQLDINQMNNGQSQQNIFIYHMTKALNISRKISISPILYFRRVFWKLNAKLKEQYLLDKGVKKISQDLNIINILEKLQQIDKLKEILFSEQQLMLFNFTSKPMITMQDAPTKRFRFYNQVNCTQESHQDQTSEARFRQDYYLKLYDAYNYIQSTIFNSPTENLFNQRIMDKIDKALKISYDAARHDVYQHQQRYDVERKGDIPSIEQQSIQDEQELQCVIDDVYKFKVHFKKEI